MNVALINCTDRHLERLRGFFDDNHDHLVSYYDAWHPYAPISCTSLSARSARMPRAAQRCVLLARRLALRLPRGAAAIAALVAGNGRRASRPRGLATESTRPAEIPHGDRERLNFDRSSSAGDAVDVASGDVLRIKMKAIAEARVNRS